MLTVFDAASRERPRLMLTQGEDVEVDALAKRGWTISAIARHLGRDRKTVRAYVEGEREPGSPPPARSGSA
jgi:IS30 family transposase